MIDDLPLPRGPEASPPGSRDDQAGAGVEPELNLEGSPARDECQDRLWLRAILPILQQRHGEPDPDASVQTALDRMHRAAADRCTRILRADMVDR